MSRPSDTQSFATAKTARAFEAPYGLTMQFAWGIILLYRDQPLGYWEKRAAIELGREIGTQRLSQLYDQLFINAVVAGIISVDGASVIIADIERAKSSASICGND